MQTSVISSVIVFFLTTSVGLPASAQPTRANLRLSGQELLEFISSKLFRVDDDIRYPSQAGGCFIKGTRIHTKKGLKPIEEIKIGDYVLSSPEDGSGSPEYKRVVNTFVHELQAIFEINITSLDWSYSWGQGSSSPIYSIVATGNHPFWVEGVGWTRADNLREGNILRKADGGFAKISSLSPVYRTAHKNIGWVADGFDIENTNGHLFDYANYKSVEGYGRDKYLSSDIFESDDPYLRVPVYNFEVEDFHTYYVGGLGFWVHNANCEGVRLANGTGVLPSVDLPLYDGVFALDDAISRGLQRKEGFAVIRSQNHGVREKYKEIIQLLDTNVEHRMLYPWLQFEDLVVGRLEFEKIRHEYAVFFENPEAIGTAAKHYLRVEGRDVSGEISTFVDRKLSMGKFFKTDGSEIKIGEFADLNGMNRANDALGLLWRVTQALEQNPNFNWRFEMPALQSSMGEGLIAELKAAGRQAQALFDAIVQGKIGFSERR